MSRPRTSVPDDRLSGLDVLRGLAILLVVAGHYRPHFASESVNLFAYTLGGAGVILFFYLSGFLICRTVQSQSATVFLGRRFFKLFPAYWVNILSILLVSLALGDSKPFDSRTILSNLLMIQEFTHSDLLNGVYWTLQVEIKFYLLMVAFHAVFGIGRIYYLLAALFLGNLASLLVLHHGSVQLTYLIVFFPGIAAARLWQRGERSLGELAAVTAVAALNLQLFLNANNSFHAVQGLLFAPLLVLALRQRWRFSGLRFFGRISYSHYLYHSSVGYLLLAGLEPFASFGQRLAGILLVLAATVVVASLSFYGIEQPVVRFGRFLEERSRSSPAAAE